jgi:hypothetical protein
MATKIGSMMESLAAHARLLKFLRETRPANLQQDKEEGAEYVWDLNRANDPFHSDGLGKTRHNEDADE